MHGKPPISATSRSIAKRIASYYQSSFVRIMFQAGPRIFQDLKERVSHSQSSEDDLTTMFCPAFLERSWLSVNHEIVPSNASMLRCSLVALNKSSPEFKCNPEYMESPTWVWGRPPILAEWEGVNTEGYKTWK